MISRSKCILYKNRSHLDYIRVLEKIFKGKKLLKSSSKNALKLTSPKQHLIELYQKFINELLTLIYDQSDFINFIKDLIAKLEKISENEEKHIFLSTNLDFYKKLFDLVEVECDSYLNKSVIMSNNDQQNSKSISQFNSPVMTNQKLKKPNTFDNHEDMVKIINILDIKDLFHSNAPKCEYITENGILIEKLKNDIELLQTNSNYTIPTSNKILRNRNVKNNESTVDNEDLFVKYEFNLMDYCIIC